MTYDPSWVQRGPGPLPPTPPPRKPPVTSSEEDQEDASTVEDQNPGFQSPVVSTAAEPVTSLAVEEGGAAESPTDGQQGQAVAPPPKLGAPPPPPPASSYWVQRGPGPLPPTSTVEDQNPGFQSPVVSTAAEPVTSLGQAVAPPPKLGAPPPPPPASSYWVQRGPGPLPPTSTVEDQNPGFQSPVVSTAAEPVTSLAVEEGGAAESPTDGQQGQAVAPPPKLGAPPPPPPASSYWVQRGPGPLPPTSTVEDQNPGFQSPVVSTAAEPVTSLAVEEGGAAESPTDGQKVVKPSAIISPCPSSSSFSPSSSSSHTPLASHLPVPAHNQPRTVAMAMPATPPWLVNELGEPLCTVVAPPSYSYHPNGSDLPGDCRVLQYYFNLGVQWCHQNCWQLAYAPPSPEAPYTYQAYPHYHAPPTQDASLHGAPPQSYPEAGRGPGSHHTPPSYPESTRPADGQTDGHGSGPALSLEVSSPTSSSISRVPTGSAPPPLLYPEQPLPPAPSPLPLPPPPPHPHSSYHTYLPPAPLPPAFPPGGPAHGTHPRVYQPATNPTHMVGYITAPPPHHSATHYLPPSM
ncbi:extensin-like isoform X4 [Myripristis murdjan]|uniref:extensin-like isoform X4 n=1 Tax=Myripristis murdjan TaxID=586833 RepID=UPI0011761C5F|nr:extensin-like isoform X4 [Myripristis murdjan]